MPLPIAFEETNMVDLLERIDVLLKQEDIYMTEDYLASDFQASLFSRHSMGSAQQLDSSSIGTSTYSSSTTTSGINEVWREKICEWSYQVVDHFEYSREVVSVSIHYLDRFLSTVPVNKKVFQLAAMTALYLAVKLHEPGTLTMAAMMELSRGFFTVEQMAEMEVAILRALGWFVHPPTAFCFAKHLLFLLPNTSVAVEARHDILETARFLTELSVIDYYFVTHRPSNVALAAVLNTLEYLPGVPDAARVDFEREIQRVNGLNPFCEEVHGCRARLRMLLESGGYSRPAECDRQEEPRPAAGSPVCVSCRIETL